MIKIKQKILLTLVTVLFASGTATSSQSMVARPPKAIIFDLHGVISQVNKSGFISTVGLITILRYAYEQRTFPWNLASILQEKFYTVLNRCEYTLELEPGTVRARTGSGDEFPALMHAYQAGKISAEDARAIIQSTIEKLKTEDFFSSGTEAVIVERAVLAYFTPEIYAQGQMPIAESAELLKDLAALRDSLHENAFKLIALSNWDQESFALFSIQHNDVFSCFDTMYVSGKNHYMKPNDEAFLNVLSQEGLLANDCIFIDDQGENCVAAEKIGMHAHHFTDAAALRAYLKSAHVVLSEDDWTNGDNGTAVFLSPESVLEGKLQ